MCRMFATASMFSTELGNFMDFRKLAVKGVALKDTSGAHEDGWGVAGYLGKWTVHFGRSAGSCMTEENDYKHAVEKAINADSRIIVAHLRQASEGTMRVENSHPFIHGDWIFCHNGTVQNSEKLMLTRFEYEGTTDSERLFKFIKSRLEYRRVQDYSSAIKMAVEEVKALCGSTSLTFVMANKSFLIGYREYSKDESYYTLYYSAGKKDFMFCSEPMPGREWKAMSNSEIIIIDKYGNSR